MNFKNLKSGLLWGAFACGGTLLAPSIHAQPAPKEYVEPDFSEAKPVRMEILQDGGKRTLGASFCSPLIDRYRN